MTSGLRVISLQGLVGSNAVQAQSAFVAAQEESLREIGVDVLPFLIEGPNFLKYPMAIRRFRRFVADSNADLIHAHFVYNGIVALCQRRLPTVVSFLGADVLVSQIRDQGAPVRAGLTFVLSQLCAFAADTLIVKSESMRKLVWRQKGVHVVPNGVDLDQFKPSPRDEARRQLGLPIDKHYVLFASSPARPEKDYPLARLAFEIAQQNQEDLELLLLDGVGHELVPTYLNAADVLLFTSKSEGSPNVVKEAMACNLPIVTVDVGDVRAVIDGADRCAVVPTRSPALLAQEIVSLIVAGGRSSGREKVRDLDRLLIAERLVAIYQNAVRRRDQGNDAGQSVGSSKTLVSRSGHSARK